MRGRRCRICHGLLEVFQDGPGCRHLPSCWVGFCWREQRIVWRGRCAEDLMRDIEVATIVLGPRFAQQPGGYTGS